jgi:hypothetical protein
MHTEAAAPAPPAIAGAARAGPPLLTLLPSPALPLTRSLPLPLSVHQQHHMARVPARHVERVGLGGDAAAAIQVLYACQCDSDGAACGSEWAVINLKLHYL